LIIYASLGFLFITSITALQNMALWGTNAWWQGLAAGYVLGMIWLGNRRVAMTVLPLMLGLLAWIVFTPGASLSLQTRSVFSGMSIALPFGIATTLVWRWKSYRPTLVTIARIERHHWLLRLLGEKYDQ